jgi:3-dehydroquinate synthase
LAVADLNIYNVYGKQMEKYLEHYGLKLKIVEKAKTIPTLLNIVDSMNEFGIYRKVCVLAIYLSPV